MLEELMRKWHPVSIGDAVLNIFQYRNRSTLTAFKNCPPFLRLTYATKDLCNTQNSHLSQCFPLLHTMKDDCCDFLYCLKNK